MLYKLGFNTTDQSEFKRDYTNFVVLLIDKGSQSYNL